MRKPRDLDAELASLSERAKTLKARRVTQLGELVIASGADGLDLETLMGALLAAASEPHATVRAGWKVKGAAHFQGKTAGARPRGGAGEGLAPDAQAGGDDPSQ
jgi:DNA-binding protein H-NS